MRGLLAIPADGHEARWQTWDGEHEEVLTLRWDNEAWTAMADVGRERIQYVLRLSPTWRLRQFLLFRDLEAPDLWLATDGHARWGEVNGAHRPELDGCLDVEVPCSAFPTTVPIRRLPLDVGDAAELPVITVDVETLALDVEQRRYERLGERSWRHVDVATDESVEFDVDAYGLPVDHPGRFRRR
jgi:uncharacterized protein